MKSPITTHILDTARGRPAASVPVFLRRVRGSQQEPVAEGKTNDDGRVVDWMGEQALEVGDYVIEFDTASYFEAQGVEGFYPSVSIRFRVDTTDEHYHVPLLLNPYGYSTYRGS